MEYESGSRLRCDECGSEAIVVNAAEAQMVCCEKELVVTFVPGGGQVGN